MSESFFDVRQRLLRPASPGVEPESGAEPLSVSEVARRINRVLKDGFAAPVTVRGELSNVSDYRPRGGHLYFTLKDADAQIGGTMWKARAAGLKFKPADGAEVVVRGRIDHYVKGGKTQISAESMEPVGAGALELARRELYIRLDAEGLFDDARKVPIPPMPRRIAIVSSPNAAGFGDIVKVFRPFRFLRLFLYPVPVQGGAAAPAIAAALGHLGARSADVGGVDLVILARGGGSIEDLWAFNEEAVVRAVAGCRLPVVVGVGHEQDKTVADYAADHRAHTPTEAARVAVAGWERARQQVEYAGTRLRSGVRDAVRDGRNRLTQVERHETFRRPTDPVERLRQRVDDAQQRLAIRVGDRLSRSSDRVGRLSAALAEQHPRHRTLVRRQQVDDLAGRLARSVEAARARRSADVDRIERALLAAVERRLRASDERVDRATQRLERRHPRTRLPADRERLSRLDGRLAGSVRARLARAAGRVDVVAAKLGALDPTEVLRRGYSITTLDRTGRALRTAADARPGDRLTTRTADGEVGSTVDGMRQPRLFDA